MQWRTKDVAKFLGVSEKTVGRWVEEEHLPAFRMHNQYRFNRVEVMEWAMDRKMNVRPDLSGDDEDEEEALAGLVQALECGGIHYEVVGHDKATVMRSMVRVLPLDESVDREFLFQILWEREALGSTAVGDGVAIPHVRNPIVLPIAYPIVALCFLKEPVDFGALDKIPVRVLFTILSPTIRAHLHVLSLLAHCLRDSKFHAALDRKASAEEVLAETRRVMAGLETSRETELP